MENEFFVIMSYNFLLKCILPHVFNYHTLSILFRKPALHYYSQKLLWIDQNNKIIVSDLEGKNLATLSEDPAHALSIVQESSLHPLPGNYL